MKDDPRSRSRIPPEELSAWERWELPLLDERGNEVPREEEVEVKPLTAADIEAIRQSAWEEGHQEGHQAGYDEGLRLGKQEGQEAGYQEGRDKGEQEGRQAAQAETRSAIDEKLARLESVLAELVAPIERHQDELESALVNLATVLARSVIYRELTLDSSQIRQVVADAVASLPSTRENVRVRINPADAEWVREAASRLDAEISITKDEGILAGGCKVETRHSLVDYTVEKRFQKAVQAMLEQQLGQASAGESEELESVMGDLSDFHRDVMDEPPESADREPADDEPEQPSTGESDNDHKPG
ncbi:flagellar assembly protein FliH [Marinobacter daqiaonensis]|uniref:Flagellar assembly protein FliH n=1 Tax=Marinobacter daqiaonensis TaxID=650891 RepID=A0A1I6H759_9GAMM|nr:flagellar assembly protein FliH [Marinobacter daqiaonensis]SFR50171.1 flagellar assembly protein FliH [Marinobacter daqiaonensis]